MRNVWTQEELLVLKTHYQKKGAKYVAQTIGRSLFAVRMKASDLKIKFISPTLWTKEENAFIRKYYSSKGAKYIAKKLGKSAVAVTARAGRIGIRGTIFIRWKEWEIRYLKKNYLKKTARSIGRTLHKSMDAIHSKAAKLSIKQPSAAPWTEEETKKLIKLFPDSSIPVKQIEEILKRPQSGIWKKARKLGLLRKGFWVWTKEMDAFVLQNHSQYSLAEVARKLDVNEKLVYYHAKRLGITPHVSQRKWSKAENEFLLDNYQNKSPYEIADLLNRTVISIQNHLRVLLSRTSLQS
jgi:DNA-binding CsgD family transcriptional regulator